MHQQILATPLFGHAPAFIAGVQIFCSRQARSSIAQPCRPGKEGHLQQLSSCPGGSGLDDNEQPPPLAAQQPLFLRPAATMEVLLGPGAGTHQGLPFHGQMLKGQIFHSRYASQH